MFSCLRFVQIEISKQLAHVCTNVGDLQPLMSPHHGDNCDLDISTTIKVGELL